MVRDVITDPRLDMNLVDYMVDSKRTGTCVPALSVCHLISGDCWAGAESQALGLISALNRRSELRVSAVVLNDGKLATELRKADVLTLVIPESQYRFQKIVDIAGEFVRELKPDIFHSHRYKENLLALLLARRLGKVATVRTQHGMPEPFYGAKGVRHYCTQIFDELSGRRWADAVVSVSSEMLPKLRKKYGSKAVLVRNGLDTSRVKSCTGKADVRRDLGLQAHVPVIGFVGRLEPVKRMDIFLEMAAVLTRRLPNAVFLVSGTGSLQKDLSAMAKKAGLDGQVRFLGHRDDIVDVLQAMNVLVMCSDHEGLPMVLLEALWLGVPIVGRGVGGIREILGDNECGLCVDSSQAADFAEACEQLLNHPALRERLLSAAKERINSEFTVERSAESIVQLYRQLSGK